MIRKIILCAALIIFCISLTSCQTVQGVGGDIQWIGQKCAELLEGDSMDEEAELEETY